MGKVYLNCVFNTLSAKSKNVKNPSQMEMKLLSGSCNQLDFKTSAKNMKDEEQVSQIWRKTK